MIKILGKLAVNIIFYLKNRSKQIINGQWSTRFIG